MGAVGASVDAISAILKHFFGCGAKCVAFLGIYIVMLSIGYSASGMLGNRKGMEEQLHVNPNRENA